MKSPLYKQCPLCENILELKVYADDYVAVCKICNKDVTKDIARAYGLLSGDHSRRD